MKAPFTTQPHSPTHSRFREARRVAESWPSLSAPPHEVPAAHVARLKPATKAGLASTAVATGLASVLVALCFIAAPAAFAQSDADDPFAGIEEMVVVGTGAASLFQNQEVSAIAFDADHLEAIGANDLSDVATFTPNLEIRTPFAASNPTLFIRGVGLRDFNANSSSSVAVYNDEIYMNSPAGQLAQLFDTQNIDVLRGPQTTSYGRNSSAGTIRVIARKPTGTPGATGSVTYGTYNELNFETAIENVIVPDVLTIRTAGKWSQRQGHTKNRCADTDYANNLGNVRNPGLPENQNAALIDFVHEACFSTRNTDPNESPPANGWTVGQPAPVKEWVNDTKNWAARSILRYQGELGNAEMDWMLNVHGGQNRGDARQFQFIASRQQNTDVQPRIAPGGTLPGGTYLDADNRIWRNRNNFNNAIYSPFFGNPFEGDYNNIEKEKIDLFGTNLVGELTFGDYTVTTITGYEWNKRDTTIDLDGRPADSLEPSLNNRAYQLTEEVRLDFDDGGGFSWQLAGMFLYEGLTVDNSFKININSPQNQQKYTFFTRYGAAWWNFAWEPSESFSIKGGVRVNYEEKELNLTVQRFDVGRGTGILTPQTYPSSFPDVALRGTVVPPLPATSAAKEWGWAGDLIASYSPATDVSFYLRFARGWKGPHINGGITSPGPPGTEGGELATPVEPEIIDSVEAGLKAEFWSNRIRWNWAVFYYDYQDIQVFQLKNSGGSVPVQQLINADDADVFGIEMEFDVKPFEGWAPPIMENLWIRLTFAYLDSKYTDFVNVNTAENFVNGQLVTTTVTEDFSGNQLVNSPKYSFIGFVAYPFGGSWGQIVPRIDWSYKDRVYFSPANSDLVKQDPLWLFNFRATYKAPSENFEISAWVENLTDQAYTVDIFNLARLSGTILHAIGDPRTYGVTMKVTF